MSYTNVTHWFFPLPAASNISKKDWVFIWSLTLLVPLHTTPTSCKVAPRIRSFSPPKLDLLVLDKHKRRNDIMIENRIKRLLFLAKGMEVVSEKLDGFH